MTFKGSCHCGKMSYEVDAEMQPATACNCSICSRRGYLLWFLPAEKLKLQAPLEGMSSYTFNSHKIRHYFCAICGTGTFGMAMHEGKPMAAVNVRCLEGVDLLKVEVKHFDGRKL